MSYTKQTLLPEEKVLYQTKPHLIVFYPVFLWGFLATYFFSTEWGTVIGSLLLAISIVSMINSFINYYCSEYVITTKRILVKVGFIRRRSLEIFLERIEGIYIEQSIIGRILNFGTVFVGGIGGTKTPFYFIPNPIEFRSHIQQQIQSLPTH